MLFFEFYKTMANKVTFGGFRGGDRPNRSPGSDPVCYKLLHGAKEKDAPVVNGFPPNTVLVRAGFTNRLCRLGLGQGLKIQGGSSELWQLRVNYQYIIS